MNTFDFADIVEYDGSEADVHEHAVFEDDNEMVIDTDELSWLDEEAVEDEEVEAPDTDLVSIGGDLNVLEDDFELTIGEEKLTKADLIAKVQASGEATKKVQELDSYFQNFKNIDDQMNHAFVASATENDIKLTNVKNKLRDPNITDADRGRLYTELNKLEGNKKVLDERVQGFFAARDLREQQAELVRLTQTNAAMEMKYGKQWVDTMAPAVTQYINESGIASPEMRKAVTPAMLEVLIKAMKYDKMEKGGKAQVKAAVAKKPTAARSTVSKAQGRGNTMSKRELEYRRALKSGDNTALYQFLVD